MENAKKIRPDEVVILSAGEQIRRKVLGTGKTIEDFAREINFYPVSVKQYLRRHDGGSSSFKVKLTQYFQQGYNEIVRNPEAQLAEKCAQLSENIHLYTEEGDAEVIAHLTRLVEEQGLAAQLPWMQRNLALNRFYQNRVSEALALLFTAEAAVKTGRDVLARATFSADLALIHYYLCEYEPAADWIQEAEQALERLTEPGDKLRFLVAFRRGSSAPARTTAVRRWIPSAGPFSSPMRTPSSASGTCTWPRPNTAAAGSRGPRTPIGWP